MNKARKCQLHPQCMNVSEKGVDDYFWPVTFEELELVRDHLLECVMTWVRNEDIDKSRDAELTWLILPLLVREFMRIFNATSFVERARLNNIEPVFFDDSKLFVPIYEGRWPEKGSDWQRIYSGLINTRGLKQWLRFAKYLVNDSSFTYKPKWALNRNSDVLTLSINPLIEAHAKKKNIKLVFSKFDDWFSSGSLHGKKLPAGISKVNVDKLLEFMSESYMKCNMKMPGFIAEYMQDYIASISSATEFYLREAELLSNKLPLELWTGTMGIIWYRILGRVVQKNGGVVTTHDHGTGTGWYDSYIQTIVEFNYSDRFIVASSLMADGLCNSRRADLMIRDVSIHEIISLENI